LFTKSDNFGHRVVILKGSSNVEKDKVPPVPVPADDLVLYWATFTDAADEAGISRRFGGIHFVDGDMEARKLGRVVAKNAWKKTLGYLGHFKEGNLDHQDEGDHDREQK